MVYRRLLAKLAGRVSLGSASPAIRSGRRASFAFVLFSKNLFEPMCLPISDRLIHKRGRMTDDEVVAHASHRRIPISWKPAAFSRLCPFFTAN